MSLNNIFFSLTDYKYIVYDVKGSRRLKAKEIKVELDEALSGLSESHTAVIHNLESLASQAAMILHGYCDNENAPYKQASY